MDNLPDIISSATAVLALIFSLLSYVKTRKIENQQYRINSYELSKIEEEKKRLLLAELRISLTKIKGGRMLYIENIGLSNALNIEITPINQCVIITSNIKSFTLLPNSSVSLNITPYANKEKARFIVKWEDEAGQHEELFTTAL